MSRLIERVNEKEYYTIDDSMGSFMSYHNGYSCREFRGEPINKLGQLEDIEEELGIELITIFKAFKYGFWFKEEESLMTDNEKERFKWKHYIDYDSEHKLMFQAGLDRIKGNCSVPIAQLSATILNGKIEYFLIAHSAVLLLKDYGKTWALTKEELQYE